MVGHQLVCPQSSSRSIHGLTDASFESLVVSTPCSPILKRVFVGRACSIHLSTGGSSTQSQGDRSRYRHWKTNGDLWRQR